MTLNFPPTLPPSELQELSTLAIDYACSHGLLIRDSKSNFSLHHAPVTLFPSPFPQSCFDLAYKLQPIWNTLVDKIANDPHYLLKHLESVSEHDDFTRNLLDILKRTSQLSKRQFVRIGLHRSDYMVDKKEGLKQVELNTISSSFSSLSSLTTQLHHYLSKKTDFFNSTSKETMDIHLKNLPLNSSIKSLAKGLAKGWELYGNPKAHVLMVVQPNEGNIFDQRWIEYELFSTYSIPLMRATLADILSFGELKSDSTFVYKNKEIAVVYFRAGYTPNDYPTENEWNARWILEASMAIKCPCIEYHLVGTKKIQQVLANPNELEQFLNSKDSQLLRSCFVKLWPLDESDLGREALNLVLSDSQGNYVMKPQREGGGNNIYGLDIKNALKSMSLEDASAYILMEMIRPPSLKNVMLRKGDQIQADVVSELGIYGIWVSDGDICHLNESGGHLLRTKTVDSNEGGVAAGYAVIDSPVLF